MRRPGFTLAEVLVTLGVVILLYALVSYTTVQLSRAARSGTRAAAERLEVLKAAEQLRWQLRCLYPGGDEPLRGQRGSGEDNQDLLMFLTARTGSAEGVAEVGYRVARDEAGQPYLAYREFPYVPAHPLQAADLPEVAPWKPLARQVTGLRLDYSAEPEGEVWQREWGGKRGPSRVRVTLVLRDGRPCSFVVFPGAEAQRW